MEQETSPLSWASAHNASKASLSRATFHPSFSKSWILSEQQYRVREQTYRPTVDKSSTRRESDKQGYRDLSWLHTWQKQSRGQQPNLTPTIRKAYLPRLPLPTPVPHQALDLAACPSEGRFSGHASAKTLKDPSSPSKSQDPDPHQQHSLLLQYLHRL